MILCMTLLFIYITLHVILMYLSIKYPRIPMFGVCRAKVEDLTLADVA